MQPVNKKIADRFHRESEEGIDAVFGRMLQAVGNPVGSYADAFDVSENTLKSWRRRGSVSTKFLQGFSKEYGVSLDYLLYGDRGGHAEELALNASEQVLIEQYRAAPKPLRDAALRVLLGGDEPQKKIKKLVNVSAAGGQAAGRNIVNKRGKW